jgi:Zn finger protein HypA/HybF involved in hydrogenase expression
METIRTIECYSCDYTTDVEIADVTAPRHCPECHGDLFVSGTDVEWPTADAAIAD